jgi:hypothetical protein
MRRTILAAALTALALPALADTYPVFGAWGVNPPVAQGPVDCTKLRVIAFNGDQRTDSKGGVPAYRNVSVTPSGSTYRVVDQFTNGMISDGRVTFTLRVIDADHVEMTQGSTLKLQRCR